MIITDSLPKKDGFFMPAEFSPHEATIMIWPYRAGSWGNNPEEAENVFAEVIKAISAGEKVYVLAGKAQLCAARAKVSDYAEIICLESDDAWARDTAPTFVTDGRNIRGVNWRFNAWGGEYDGLYADWRQDDALSCKLAEKLGFDVYDASPFVLEGGSVHSDGDGTLMVTEACLLSQGRNPELTKKQIGEKLCNFLGGEKILWLPRGIYKDETNEHVDNICAFTAPGKVVLAWTDNKDDPQYALSAKDYEYLSGEIDARGRRFEILKLPIPQKPVIWAEEDCAKYSFEDGEDVRSAGERLAASYVNFYFANGAVIVPQFGGENEKSDNEALKILEKACPGRKIIGIKAGTILKGGGNIHCITQQIPKGAAR